MFDTMLPESVQIADPLRVVKLANSALGWDVARRFGTRRSNTEAAVTTCSSSGPLAPNPRHHGATEAMTNLRVESSGPRSTSWSFRHDRADG